MAGVKVTAVNISGLWYGEIDTITEDLTGAKLAQLLKTYKQQTDKQHQPTPPVVTQTIGRRRSRKTRRTMRNLRTKQTVSPKETQIPIRRQLLNRNTTKSRHRRRINRIAATHILAKRRMLASQSGVSSTSLRASSGEDATRHISACTGRIKFCRIA